MELFFEFIFSLIFEGSLELGTDKKLRKPVRFLAMLVFFLCFGGILLFLLFIGISILKNNSMAGGILFILFDIFLLFMGIWGILKKCREHNQR